MVRFKNRYLLFELSFEDGKIENFNISFIASLLRDSVELNFGDEGYGSIVPSLAVKYFNPLTGIGIVRVCRDQYRKLWASLTWIGDVKKRFCCFRVFHVGGTIRSCQKQAIKYDKEKIMKFYSDSDQKQGELIDQSFKQISQIDL